MMARISIDKLAHAFWPIVAIACASRVPIGEGEGELLGNRDGGHDAASGGSGAVGTAGTGGCGGEAAAGGFQKGGAPWDGTSGNPYGYEPNHPGEDCPGFGFHDTCAFYGLCHIACSDASECPFIDGGPEPVCRTRGTAPAPDAITLCILPCDDGAACPDGMSCVFHPYGFGQICMWPLFS
jgi:hypothetical protein